MYCNMSSGVVKWRFLAPFCTAPLNPPAVTADGTVLFTCPFGSSNTTIYAVTSSGSLLWVRSNYPGTPDLLGPVLGHSGAHPMVFVSASTANVSAAIYALNSSSGAEVQFR